MNKIHKNQSKSTGRYFQKDKDNRTQKNFCKDIEKTEKESAKSRDQQKSCLSKEMIRIVQKEKEIRSQLEGKVKNMLCLSENSLCILNKNRFELCKTIFLVLSIF